MFRDVISEIRGKLTLKFMLLCLLVPAFLIISSIIRSQEYRLKDWYDYFTFTLEGGLPLTFPILTILIFVASFSGEVKDRFLTYTRMRRPIMKTIYLKLSANILLTFFLYSALIFICFLFAYYIEPHLGIVKFDPSYGLTKEEIAVSNITRHTFTQLLNHGVFTYATLYSCWLGANAALYSSIGFYFVLLIRNRFLALTLPFVIYLVGSFTLLSLGIEDFRPNNALFPFDRVQAPIWTAFVPFFALLVILACLSIYVHKNHKDIESLI